MTKVRVSFYGTLLAVSGCHDAVSLAVVHTFESPLVRATRGRQGVDAFKLFLVAR